MKIRAFVFDDEEGVRHVLERVLRMRGYEVFGFADPSEFCSFCPPDCVCGPSQSCGHIILSDVRMPKLSGVDFVRRQAERGCRITNVALISGYWTGASLADAQELGCTVFQKPVRLAEINGWLDECEGRLQESEPALVDRF